jgi:hypothetical protein
MVDARTAADLARRWACMVVASDAGQQQPSTTLGKALGK